jgi:hypothetical protein
MKTRENFLKLVSENHRLSFRSNKKWLQTYAIKISYKAKNLCPKNRGQFSLKLNFIFLSLQLHPINGNS